MANGNADTICRMGISYPTAIEIARQMAAGTGNGNVALLMAVGVTGEQAKELSSQINAGVFAAHKMAAAGWNSEVAKQIKNHSGL